MNLEQVFKRFVSDWQQFGMMGLGAFLVNLVGFGIAAILGTVLAGPGLYALLAASALGGIPDFGAILSLIGSLFVFFLLLMVVGVVTGGLSSAGILGSVLGYRRGEAVSLASFWSYATKHYGKLILLGFLYSVIMMLTLLINIIPLLGTLVYLVWMPVSMVALLIYPAHMMVSRGMGVGEAFSVGFRLLTGQFKPTFISGMILLGLFLVSYVVNMIPLIGWVVTGFLLQPLVTYLFVERFEVEVAPTLQMPPAA